MTAVHAPMGPGHLAAYREPWVEVKLGTPPFACLEAFTPGWRSWAGFCRDAARSLDLTQAAAVPVLDRRSGEHPSSGWPAPARGALLACRSHCGLRLPFFSTGLCNGYFRRGPGCGVMYSGENRYCQKKTFQKGRNGTKARSMGREQNSFRTRISK